MSIDINQQQTIDRFHFEDERGRDKGVCTLTLHPLPPAPAEPPKVAVVAWERPDNYGQSVTNAAEVIHACFLAEAVVAAERVLWHESYGIEQPEKPAEIDRVTFAPDHTGRLTADWQPTDQQHWQHLGIAEPAVPSYTPVRPHPETTDDEMPLPENIGDYHPPQRPSGPRGAVIYQGERIADEEAGTVSLRVTVTDDHGTRPLHPRLDLREHSHTGLEWGYGGSGPAQLALAILADYLDADEELAVACYQQFKFAAVARFPYGCWELSGGDIDVLLSDIRGQE